MSVPSLKIGKAFFSPVVLAPMAGVTDAPFRSMVRCFGNELVFSEMVLADSLVRAHKRTGLMAACRKEETPVAVQLVGHLPEIMAQAAGRIEEQGIASLIDINMGCPVNKIIKSGSGSDLMRHKELAGEIVSAAVRAVALPVTVKFRLGWDAESANYLDFGKRMQDAGAAAVTLHARTRNQMYGGRADWDAIARLKASLSIPVIGNGDVRVPADAVKMKQETGADGVMIGRGALGKPWILSDCTCGFEGKKEVQKPPLASIVLEHFRLLEEYYGKRKAVFIARKHMAWYSLGITGGAAFRVQLNSMKEPDAVHEFVSRFFMEN